jgi:hypothetical protein
VDRGISGNICETLGSVYKKCGLRLNYGQVQGVIFKMVGIFWFQNYFTIGNDGGLVPWFMDRCRFGPPWTTRWHGLEATRARRHAHPGSRGGVMVGQRWQIDAGRGAQRW